jgi:hypothetical protein
MDVHSQFAVEILAIDRTNSLWHLTCGLLTEAPLTSVQRTVYSRRHIRLANIAYITCNADDKPLKWQ